jgi:hypothetical protein
MWATDKGRNAILLQALGLGADIHAEDNDGWSAIMYAARRGNIEALEILIVSGADINHASIERQFTALHLAAGNGLMDVCKCLLRAGALPDVVDVNNRTPISYVTCPKMLAQFQRYRHAATLSSKGGVVLDDTHGSASASMSRTFSMSLGARF